MIRTPVRRAAVLVIAATFALLGCDSASDSFDENPGSGDVRPTEGLPLPAKDAPDSVKKAYERAVSADEKLREATEAVEEKEKKVEAAQEEYEKCLASSTQEAQSPSQGGSQSESQDPSVGSPSLSTAAPSATSLSSVSTTELPRTVAGNSTTCQKAKDDLTSAISEANESIEEWHDENNADQSACGNYGNELNENGGANLSGTPLCIPPSSTPKTIPLPGNAGVG